MSIQTSIHIKAHKNIYNQTTDRNLRIDYCVPDNGINKDTGLVIFVPGFGGNMDSNVYVKMRNKFADTYNLVTIQCDYFGSSYMQGVDNFTIAHPEKLQSYLTVDEMKEVVKEPTLMMPILSKKEIVLDVRAIIQEDIEEFNDMSYMQAIDIITAVETVRSILIDKKSEGRFDRVIGYGHSHGAYLLYLSNRLSNIFSYIIDNSGWILPKYLLLNRFLYSCYNKLTLRIEFDYLAKTIIQNKSDLNLENLYRDYQCNTQIISFQGDEDNLIDHIQKQEIIDKMNDSKFILVKKEDVDQIKYKSNNHGLDADFLEIFSYALKFERPISFKRKQVPYSIDFEGVSIEVDYINRLPVFDFRFRT